MNAKHLTLVKREFWEHRALWMAPAIAAACLLVLTVFGAAMGGRAMNFGPGPAGPGPDIGLQGRGIMAMSAFSLAAQIFGIACIVAVVYLLDCLYAERKDRSILFWKSLPVSDTRTVLVKFGVAMLVLPLAVYALAVVTHLLASGIMSALAPQFVARTGGWDLMQWLQIQGWLLGVVLVSVLWFAPAAAWLMLASVLAKRSPWLIVGLPVVALGIGENILLGSQNVWRYVGRRMLPMLRPEEALVRPDLWLGLAAAAVMLYIVIRLRRYRDDT